MAVQNAGKKSICFETNKKGKQGKLLLYQDILKERDKLLIAYMQTKAVMEL